MLAYTRAAKQLGQPGLAQPPAGPCLLISPAVACLAHAGGMAWAFRDAAAAEELTKKMEEMKILLKEIGRAHV